MLVLKYDKRKKSEIQNNSHQYQENTMSHEDAKMQYLRMMKLKSYKKQNFATKYLECFNHDNFSVGDNSNLTIILKVLLECQF